MKSTILFASSCLCTLVHFYYVPIVHANEIYAIYAGLSTSLLNHYFDSTAMQALDRFLMRLLFLHHVYYYDKKVKVCLAGLCYCLSKVYKPCEALHVLSHVLLTMAHIEQHKIK